MRQPPQRHLSDVPVPREEAAHQLHAEDLGEEEEGEEEEEMERGEDNENEQKD